MPKEIQVPLTKMRVERFSFLFVSLMVYLALEPFLMHLVRIRILMYVFLTLVLISGVYAASEKKRHVVVSGTLAVSSIISLWWAYFSHSQAALLTGELCAGVFFCYTAMIVLVHLFREEEITSDVIVGSICVYLLLGITWAFGYSLLESWVPESFRLPQEEILTGRLFLYYSFITLSTVGYGDITPLTAPARSLAFLEAVTGQIYLAVLIGRLVGIHIAQSMEKRPRN
jgi:voltage-gated potassium channel